MKSTPQKPAIPTTLDDFTRAIEQVLLNEEASKVAYENRKPTPSESEEHLRLVKSKPKPST